MRSHGDVMCIMCNAANDYHAARPVHPSHQVWLAPVFVDALTREKSRAVFNLFSQARQVRRLSTKFCPSAFVQFSWLNVTAAHTTFVCVPRMSERIEISMV